MGRKASRKDEASNDEASTEEAAEEEPAKWNDAGAVAEELPPDPSFWKNDLPLLVGTAVVLLIDVLSIAAIVTAVAENDRPTGT